MSDPRQGRAWQALREQVFNRDGRQCAQCGHTGSASNPLEVDHKVPLNKGGEHHLDNLQVLCRKHNRQKSDNELTRVNWFNPRWLDKLEN